MIAIHGRRMTGFETDGASHSEPPSSSRVRPSSTIARPGAGKWEVACRPHGSSSPTTTIVGVGWIARPEVSL